MDNENANTDTVDNTDANESTESNETEHVDWEAKYKEAVAESRKWEKRAKASNTKADNSKSDLEKATEKASKLEAELSELKAEKARNSLIAEIAKESKVNVDILSRMAGDDRESIEANAEILKSQGITAKNSYPSVKDKAAGKNPPMTKDEILAIKNKSERRKAIAENLSLFDK